MHLLDVNILIYAHRPDSDHHRVVRPWLDTLINSDEAYGVADLALSGFLRIVTHPKAFVAPTPMDQALVFTQCLRERPNCVVVAPGQRHWEIFIRLCRETNIKGHLVPDAYFAALAIESGCQWVTTDRDFARFPGLNWSSPLGESG